MEKSTKEEYPAPAFGLQQHANKHVPAHKNFRDKYFKGFRKDDEVDTNMDGVGTSN
jgi:tRNA (guanine10-N2)-methyltransferase